MDYEITWDRINFALEDGGKLVVDTRLRENGLCYIDVEDIDGYLYDCVCEVRFPSGTSEAYMEDVMQTILMMAKARYGL